METFKDPVCGMIVREGEGLATVHESHEYHFCSEFCQTAFKTEPARYVARLSAGAGAGADPARRIAYFSMEVAVDPKMPTYSGGLGVLAGDTLKSCADLKVPIVAVGLMYRSGYFEQRLDEWGNQQEAPAVWDPAQFACPLPTRVTVTIEGRSVVVGAWQYDIFGATGYHVPLLLLDTNSDENTPEDRELTGWLYGSDERYRLAQEIILGIGGVRMLQALGYSALERFHLNEGHAALLVLELLGQSREVRRAHTVEKRDHFQVRELLRQEPKGTGDVFDFDDVRRRCVFTTHTPVPAGHDQFSYELFARVAGEPLSADVTHMLGGADRLNMTLLALNTSHYVNGVAKKHGEVSREMFVGYPIDSITNGVHSRTWTCESFRKLYDRYIPGWVNDPASLRYALGIPKEDIWEAHVRAKTRLMEEVKQRTGLSLEGDVLTIGFARRATAYKRADLLFRDPRQLADIARTVGPIQVLFAGKAHPKDAPGKDLIRRVVAAAKELRDRISIAYLENYDMNLALRLTSGVDLWLNTPLRPLEASGTSGMKAAHNGVPSLSVLDGWWLEGHIEGVTGWSIGPRQAPTQPPEETDRRDSEDLYRKLRTEITPTFYTRRERWVEIMQHVIAFNASFFNTHRMVQQYVTNAYL